MLRLCFVHVVMLCVAYAQRPVSQGFSNLTHTAEVSMNYQSEMDIGGSFFYQKSTNRLVSSNTIANSSSIAVAIPYSNANKTITIGTRYYDPTKAAGDGTPTSVTNNIGYGTFGLLPDPENDANFFACVGTFPPLESQPTWKYLCGVLYFDGTTGSATTYYNFTGVHVEQGGNCLVDDLIITTSSNQNTAIYATGFNSFQIFKYDLVTDTPSVINSNMSLLCATYETQGASSCTGYPAIQGPNGIALFTDSNDTEWLIIAISNSTYGFVKMSLDGQTAKKLEKNVNTPPLISLFTIDGIALYGSKRNSVIYAATTEPYADDPAMTFGAVQVFSSIDEWSSFDIRTVYNASCQQPPQSGRATAVRFGGPNGGDLVIQCLDNFFSGRPQYFNVLDDVAGDPIANTIGSYTTNPQISPPENILYDPNNNMIVFGSLGDPSLGLVGYPYPNREPNGIISAPISYGNDTLHQYIPSGNLGDQNALGKVLGLILSEMDNCYAYLVSGDTSNSKDGYLYSVSLCENKIVDSIELPKPSDGSDSLPNDLDVLDGYIYITDTFANRVLRVLLDDNHQFGATEVVIEPERVATNDPNVKFYSPDGIRGVDNYLLISSIKNLVGGYQAPIFKYVPSTNTMTVVKDTTGVLNDFDKIIFNHDKSILFGTRNDVNPLNYSTIMAMASCDGWETNNLLYSFQTDCEANTNPPGIVFVDGDVVSLCANGLKAGPYNLQRVRYATQVVTGGNKFCGQSSASTSQSCSSNSDSLSDGGIAGIAVATFVFGAAIATIATIYVLRGKNAFNPSPRMEMSTSNPMSSA